MGEKMMISITGNICNRTKEKEKVKCHCDNHTKTFTYLLHQFSATFLPQKYVQFYNILLQSMENKP